MDSFAFLHIAAKEHDKHFLFHLDLPANSWLVFDRAYNHYSQFAKFIEQKVWFVTRMKSNALYHVTKVLVNKTKRKNAKGVIKVQAMKNMRSIITGLTFIYSISSRKKHKMSDHIKPNKAVMPLRLSVE